MLFELAGFVRISTAPKFKTSVLCNSVRKLECIIILGLFIKFKTPSRRIGVLGLGGETWKLAC